MGVHAISHAELRVNDLAAAVDFHSSTLGLVEIERANGIVYFGCAPGDSFDVALRSGGTGVERFTWPVDDKSDLVRFEHVFTKHGVASSRLTDPEPGVLDALRFKLPSGHLVDLAVLTRRALYYNPARATPHRTAAGAPRDLDHITLRAGDRVKQTIDFLRDVLGFRSSDIVDLPDGSPFGSWMHIGYFHHDIALFQGNPGETLDHVAWSMTCLDHIKLGVDRLRRDGLDIETGPGRHGVGGNLYTYFWTPGGNRYEFSSEMPRAADLQAPAVHWDGLTPSVFSSWNAMYPDSFRNGS